MLVIDRPLSAPLSPLARAVALCVAVVVLAGCVSSGSDPCSLRNRGANDCFHGLEAVDLSVRFSAPVSPADVESAFGKLGFPATGGTEGGVESATVKGKRLVAAGNLSLSWEFRMRIDAKGPDSTRAQMESLARSRAEAERPFFDAYLGAFEDATGLRHTNGTFHVQPISRIA